jgi:hypothetical protein
LKSLLGISVTEVHRRFIAIAPSSATVLARVLVLAR